jgi:hypothetical protein
MRTLTAYCVVYPKGTDLSVVSQHQLDTVARKLSTPAGNHSFVAVENCTLLLR